VYQDTLDETLRNIYMTTTSPPKFASLTNTSQSWHGLRQSTRKHAQGNASCRQMRRKKVRLHRPLHEGQGRVLVRRKADECQ
jgi:hypothetical protein